MKNINKWDDNCITTYSKCVQWTGCDIPCLGISNGDYLDEVIFTIVNKLCILSEPLDLSTLNLQCLIDKLGASEPSDRSLVLILQLIIDNECKLKDLIDAINAIINQEDPPLVLDLKCLTPQGVPCLQGTNTYSLLSILSIFRDAICDLIENGGGGGTSGTSGCNCTSGTSGNSGTSGANGTSGSSGTSGTTGTSGVAGGVGTISNSNCVTTGRITDVKFNGLSVTASSGSFPVTSGNTFITTANAPSVGTLLVFADGIAGSITVTDSNGVSQCQDYSGAGVYTFTGFAIGSGNWSVLLNCNACVSSSTCNSYTIQANAGGTTLEWEDCTTSAPLSIFVAEYQQYTVCSRIVPLGSYIVVSNNGPCYS